jgi:hypothetical protein
MTALLAVLRITRGEIDAALRIDGLRRRAAEGDHHALTQLLQGWPEYVHETVARLLLDKGRTAR